MAKVLSSISGNLISAASAGFAPTNSGDVSAIASAYQVVSATATQPYAGTAFLTSVNGAPVSASRAGNAANASLANSAYYDGTGRLISALPDSAAVSSIASSYAESAVSGKADSSSLSSYALSSDVSGVIDTVSTNSASWGGGGGGGIDSATCSAIASAYGHSALSSIYAGNGIYYGGADDPIIGINYDGAGPLGTNDNNVLICKTDGTTIGVNAAGELVSLVGGGVDSATVSAIASSYAESAASSKLDTSAQVVTSTASSYDMDGYAWTTEINGLEISAAKAYSASYANTAETAYSADFASSSDKATYDTDGRFLSSLTDSAAVSAIASAYQVVSSVGDDGTFITSINGSALSGAGGGGGGGVVTATGSASAISGFWPVTTSYLVSSINGSALLPYGYSSLSGNSANWNSTRTTVLNNSANWNSAYSLISGVTALMDAI